MWNKTAFLACRSNVELFQTAPTGCEQGPTTKCGRQPAPWERIERQLANEAAVLERPSSSHSHGAEIAFLGSNLDFQSDQFDKTGSGQALGDAEKDARTFSAGEAPPTLIAWEWMSCFSPFLPQADPRAAAAKRNYGAYREYLLLDE